VPALWIEAMHSDPMHASSTRLSPPTGETRPGQAPISATPTSSRIARRSAATSRLRAIASPLYRPCLKAFLLPFGAPVDSPPCIRQRSFFMAGNWQGLLNSS
jgi:hypothetical protein